MYFSRVQIRPEIFKATQLAKVLTDSVYNMHRLLWDLFPTQKQRSFIYREEIAREQLPTKPGALGEPIYYVISSEKPASDKPIFQAETKQYHPKLNQGDRLRFELRANPVVTKKEDREHPEKYLAARSLRPVTDKNKLTKRRVRHDVIMAAQKTFLELLCKEFGMQSTLPNKELKNALLSHGGDALDNRLTGVLKENFRYAERLQQSMRRHDKLEWAIKAIEDVALEKWMIDQGERHGFSLAKDDNNQFKLQSSAYQWHAIKAEKGNKSGFSSVDFLGELEITDVEKFTKALFGGIGRAKAFGCGLVMIKRI